MIIVEYGKCWVCPYYTLDEKNALSCSIKRYEDKYGRAFGNNIRSEPKSEARNIN